MARNAVQFQKGLSEPAFDRQYGTEEQCRAVVIAARWPDGFWCPACGGREHSMVATRDLFQCTACHRADLAHCGHELRLDQAAAAHLVPGDVSPDAGAKLRFLRASRASPASSWATAWA